MLSANWVVSFLKLLTLNSYTSWNHKLLEEYSDGLHEGSSEL